MKEQIYSDLALESNYTPKVSPPSSPEYSEDISGNIKLCRLDISNDELSKKYGRQKGRYVSAVCEKIWLYSASEIDFAAEVIGAEIRKMLSDATSKKIDKNFSVLVAGLGNSEITADAIGPLTVAKLTVTRHIREVSEEIFHTLGLCNISSIAPGVLSQTGIETLELVRGAVRNTSPDAVIAVDALAARSCERLGRTVQISDSGISPGSGIGNLRKAINKENLGVPVIALGVPTVVDSATLVYDAIERSGIHDGEGRLKEVLDNERGFFVSPKESDLISEQVSLLLSRALDVAFAV